MTELSAFERLYRRIVHALSRGRITLVDDTQGVQFVQVKFKADDIRDKVPRVADYGFTSNPPAGSDAIVVFLAGERANGVVVGTNDQRSRLKGLLPGEVALFDNLGRVVKLGRSGIQVLGHTSPVQVVTSADVSVAIDSAHTIRLVGHTAITGDVAITGAVSITGSLRVNGIDVGDTHTHAIDPGAVGTGGETGVPGS